MSGGGGTSGRLAGGRFPVILALVIRPVLREKVRTVLTIAGIAVGVSVIVAIQLANQSALRAFRESIDAVSGRANWQIIADAGTLDERLLLGLQPLWDDQVRFAPVIDAEGVEESTQQPIRLLAVDLLSDLHFRDYRYARIAGGASGSGTATQLLGLFQPDSVVVPLPFAREHRLSIGSPLALSINGTSHRLVVRGILEATGPATAFNGAIAVCDVAVAQDAFGLVGRLTRIDLLVPEERSDAVVARIRSKLPSGTRLERPSQRNERVEKMLRAFRVNLFALAGVALLVGMFLVYNTVLISILRRRREVGIMKMLGVSPRQIFVAFVGEGLVFGAVGSAAGLLLGVGLATGILHLIGRTINALYLSSAPQAVVLTPAVIALAFLVGVVLSVVSALQPALEAAHIAPAAMIRSGIYQSGTVARPNAGTRRRWRPPLPMLAAASFAGAAAAARLPPVGGIAVAGYGAVLLVVAGFSFLSPSIVTLFSVVTAPAMRGAFGIVGRLAAASLPASLRRTAVATAALAMATGMMVAVALMVGSFRTTVSTWIDQTISSDLWLRPARGLTTVQAAAFPPSIIDELRRVPFVAAVDPAREREILYGDGSIRVASGDFRVAAERGSLPMIRPRSAAAALTAALRSEGVFVSESFAIRYSKGVGDRIALPTAGGRRSFPVTGVYRDYSSDRGTVVMDRNLYIRCFDDAAVSTAVVYLRPGVDRDHARVALEKLFGPRYHAFAVTNGAIRKEVMTIFDQTFLITYALLAVSIVVGVLGIINTLAALILERKREIALLRVAGMTAGELRTMLLLESALLGLAATVTGVVMGYLLSWILINVINRQSFGWTIEFHVPVGLLAASLAATFAASCLAGLVPARIASRVDFATAIKAE